MVTGAIPLNDPSWSASFPAVTLRAKRAEQAWRYDVAGTTQICEQVRVGMLVHRFGNRGIELPDRLLCLLYLIGQELGRHRRGVINASSRVSNWAERMRSMISFCCCSLRMDRAHSGRGE